MSWSPCGVYSVNYRQDFAIFRTKWHWISLIIFLIVLFTFPLYGSRYMMTLISTMAISIVAVLGVTILTGYAGQISVGQAAFVGTGAYISAILMQRYHVPFPLALLLAGCGSGIIGLVFGLPAVRIKGFYLAMATLAAQLILGWLFLNLRSVTGGSGGYNAGFATIWGIDLGVPQNKYLMVMVVTMCMVFFAKNLMRTRIGRVMVAIRDNDIAAGVMGIGTGYHKLLAFFIACFYAGVSGSLWAHFVGFIDPLQFSLSDSILYLGMSIVGGMGSVMGAIFGVVFMKIMQEFAVVLSPVLSVWFPAFGAQFFAAVCLAFYAIIIILFLVFEPRGINHLWVTIKNRYRLYPFSY